MNQQRLSLYHIEWQILRISCLGRWTVRNEAKQCLSKLDAYLKSAEKSDTSEMRHTRFYQVLNLLAAVRMGYSGMGMTGTLVDCDVKNFREGVSEDNMALLLVHRAPLHYVVPTRTELMEDCNLVGLNTANRILEDLERRKAHALKKYKHVKPGQLETLRPELVWASRIIGEFVYGRQA